MIIQKQQLPAPDRKAPRSLTAAKPAASEEADAAFLRMAYPGSRVWFGTHTHEWWGLLARGRNLMCGATAETLGAEFARVAQSATVIHHAAEPP